MNVTALLAKDVKKEDPDLQSNQPSELLPDLEVKPDNRHRLYGRTLSPEPDMPLLTPELQPCSSVDKPTHNTDLHFRESNPNVAASTQCVSLNGMPELSVSIPLNGLDSLDEKTVMKSPDNHGPDDGGFVYSPISSVGSKKSSKVASAMCLSPISSCGSLTPDRQRNQELMDEKQAQFMSQPPSGLFNYSVWNSYFHCKPPLQPLPGAVPAFDPLHPPPAPAWMMHGKDSRPNFFDGVDMLANDDDDSDKMSDDECAASSSKRMSDRKRKSAETDERVMFNKRMATMTDRKGNILDDSYRVKPNRQFDVFVCSPLFAVSLSIKFRAVKQGFHKLQWNVSAVCGPNFRFPYLYCIQQNFSHKAFFVERAADWSHILHPPTLHLRNPLADSHELQFNHWFISVKKIFLKHIEDWIAVLIIKRVKID